MCLQIVSPYVIRMNLVRSNELKGSILGKGLLSKIITFYSFLKYVYYAVAMSATPPTMKSAFV